MENRLFEHQTEPRKKRTIDSKCGSRLLGKLLSVRIKEQSSQYESQLSTADSKLWYVSDFHSIDNRIHLPHGTILELLTEYSRIKWDKTTLICRLEDIIFHAPLEIMANEPFVLQTQVKPVVLSNTTDNVCVFSKGSDYMLTSHLTAVVRNIRDYECTPFVDLVQLKEKLNHRIVDKDEFYRSLERRTKVKYGPSLRAIDCAWTGEDECLCSIELGEVGEGRAARLFQSALQVLFCAAPTLKTIEQIAEVNAVYLNHRSVFAHAKFDRNSNSGSVSILDKEGDTVCQLRGITGQVVEAEEDIVLSNESLYTLRWESKPLEPCTDNCNISLWVYVGSEVVGRILQKLSQTWTNNLTIRSIFSEHPKQIVSDLVSLIANNSSINGVLFDLSTEIPTEINLVQVKDTLDSISRILSHRRPQRVRALWVIMPFNEQPAPLSDWVREMAMISPWIIWKHLSVINVGQLFAEIGCYQPTRAADIVVKYMEGKRYAQQRSSVDQIVQKTERLIASSPKRFKIINDHKTDTMNISLDKDIVQLKNETAVIAFTKSKQDWKTVWGRNAEGDNVIGVVDQISSSHIDLPYQHYCLIGSEIDPIKVIVFVEDYCCLQATIHVLKELKYNQRLRVFLSKAQLSILSQLASVKNLSLTVIPELSEYFSREINEALPIYMWWSESELKIAVDGGAEIVELNVQIPDRTVVQFVLLALSEGVYFARNDFHVLPIEDFNTAADRCDTIVIKV